MSQHHEQVVIDLLRKRNGDNHNREQPMLPHQCAQKGRNDRRSVYRDLKLAVAIENDRHLIERLGHGIAAQRVDQSERGDRWNNRGKTDDEAVRAERLKPDEAGDKQCQRKFRDEGSPPQADDHQRRGSAAVHDGSDRSRNGQTDCPVFEIP